MSDSRTFKHSGDLGDLIYSLPAVRAMGGGRILLSTAGLPSRKYDGSPSGLTAETASMLIPLLEAQPYVSSAAVWDGEESVSVDLDSFRDGRDYTKHNLCDMVLSKFGVPFSEASRPWLACGSRREAAALFARTPRYRNPAVDYARFRQGDREEAFVGLPAEHADFQRLWGPIRHVRVRDFLELAELVNGSDVLYANQSCPMAIAVGLGKSYVQEVCPTCRNCVFDRDEGTHLIGSTPMPERCLVDRRRRDVLADLALKTARLPGEMAEVGVYMGGSAMVMSVASPNKRLHLFDTFSGIPETCVAGGHRKGDFSDASLDKVEALMAGRRVAFHPGTFPGTASGLEHLRFSLVHLDGDTYQSTRDGIAFFAPRMVEGGAMVFDDWEWKACPGVARAVLERFDSRDVRPTAASQCVVRFPASQGGRLAVPMC